MPDPEISLTPRSSRFVQRYQDRLLRYYLRKYPKLFHICYDPIGEHKRARAGFGFLLGFLLGLFLYVFIIVDLRLSKYLSLTIGGGLVALLSLGCALSLQFRCICLLTIPGFFGRAGRSVLKTLVLGYIIAGPIFNLTFNGKEVMRSFACTTQLTYNLTKTKLDLMFRPFHQAMLNMNESAEQLRETLKSVNELMEPIVQEIEGEEELEELEKENDDLDELQGDTKRSKEIEDRANKENQKAETDGEHYEVKYREKISARCEDQLTRGSQRCRETFGEAYNKCFDSVTAVAAWLLCWPMKLTFVCNLVQTMGGSTICNPDGKIDVGLGEGYAALKASRERLEESLKDVKIEYNVNPRPIVTGANQAARAAAGVMRDFEGRKRFFEVIITLIKRCLSLIFFKIIFDATNYHYAYLRDIEYDNVYVTPYFRRIDARRKVRGSLTLLPLKKLERTKLLDPYGLRQSRIEKRNLFGQSAKLLLEAMTASIFVLLDRLLFEILDIVRRYAHLEITQVGHHDLSLEIRGVGLVSTLIRTLIRGFNTKRHIRQVVTNEVCLPHPARLSRYELLRIYGTYLAVWLMLLLQAYSQRLRREIGAFFYRKREKRRVLYLYNETLRRRVGFLKFARARVTERARAHQLIQESRLWLAVRLNHPEMCNWLVYFGCARFSCIVCKDVEPRRGPLYHLCPTPDCFAAYCEECWHDVVEKCLACSAEEDEDTSHDEAEEFDEDDDDEDD